MSDFPGHGGNGVPSITTERLLLRAWRDDDRPLFAKMNEDPKVMRHFPAVLTAPESNEMVEGIVDGWTRGFGLWAVERLDSHDFIGYVGFAQPRWEAHFSPCVEVGWRLAQAAWGQGFATEGASAAVEWGRQNIEFPRSEVVSFTTTANLRSRRVMEKLGMAHRSEDDFDHPLLPDWEDRRHVLYRLEI